MSRLSEQESKQVNDLASRLRLIQADSAFASAEKRRDYLQEELARSVNTVSGAARKDFLAALLCRFPVGGQILQAKPAAAAVPAPPSPPPPPLTSDELLEKFIASASQLPADRRAAFSERLGRAGFAWADKAAIELDVGSELRQRLGLKPEQKVKLTRLVQVVILLAERVSQLEQATFKTWGELKKAGQAKRSAEFRAAAALYLAGEDDSLEALMQGLVALVAALQAAMLRATVEFERELIVRLGPQQIENLVTEEGGVGFLKNKGERLWKKYAELAADFTTPGVIDRQVKDLYVKTVEAAMRGNR